MLFDMLAAVRALSNLMSLGILDNPMKSGGISTARASANTEQWNECGDIFTAANTEVDNGCEYSSAPIVL
jgi:hypothetical protein